MKERAAAAGPDPRRAIRPPACCSVPSSMRRARLTYRHKGVDRRLTDVPGHVIREILRRPPPA